MEYFDYRLLDDFFRGNWLAYISTPEYIIERIRRFRSTEAEVAMQKNYGKGT